MVRSANIAELLDTRRRNLGLSYRVLAKRSGVSQPTVQRVLGGKAPDASIRNVEAIAGALGMRLTLVGEDEQAMLQRQARRKAAWIVRMVQGTSALEAQGLDDVSLREMVEQTYHELLAGSSRKLWEE